MGQRYLVKNGLAYPTDDATQKALVEATALPDAERAQLVASFIEQGTFRLATVGEIVDDIPPMSRGWLLEQGHIELYAIPETVWRDLGRPKESE